MVGYNSLAVFLFSALALVVSGGYSIGASMLFVGSAVLLWKRPKLSLRKADYLLIGTLLLYFTVRTAVAAFHADPGREYDAPLRFLLAVPVLLLLLAYPAKPSSLWAGLAVGAIGGGIFIGWQYLAQGIARPGGTTNPIQFGNISMLLGILCMSGLVWALAQPRRAGWTVLLLLGSAFGMAGSVLTSSRSGWIAMPVCACVLCLHYASMHGRRYLYAGLLTLTALMAVAYAIPQSTVKARTLASLQEARDFSRAAHTETSSLGQRLEMWRNAMAMVPARPLLGWGKQGYMDQKLALIRQGKAPPSIGEYTNVHNEYLDALVKQGVVGLAAVLALFLLPLTLFARRLKSCNRTVHPYALAGVSLGISYMVFGLTTTFLTLNIGVMMLAFLTVILWSSLRAAARPLPVPVPQVQGTT